MENTSPNKWDDFELRFWVEGTVRRQNRPRVFAAGGVSTDTKPVALWKGQVRAAATEAMRRSRWAECPVPPLLPLAVSMHARFLRPKSGPHALDPSQKIEDFFCWQNWHASAPDGDNIAKAALDAITVVWREIPSAVFGEDSAVADLSVRKCWCAPGEEPGLAVTIRRLMDAPPDLPEGLFDPTKLPRPRLAKLKQHEAICVVRHRAGMALDEWGAFWGVSRGIAQAWEREEDYAGYAIRPEFDIDPSSLSLGEWCRVVRERINLTPRDVAHLLRVPQHHVKRQEAGELWAGPLLAFWLRWFERTEDAPRTLRALGLV